MGEITKEMLQHELAEMEKQREVFQQQMKAARNSFWQCDGACQTLHQLLVAVTRAEHPQLNTLNQPKLEQPERPLVESSPEVINDAGNTDD